MLLLLGDDLIQYDFMLFDKEKKGKKMSNTVQLQG